MAKAKNISLSSPIFEIDPSESYIIECDLSKDADAKCSNEVAAVPLQTGVGIRMTFYDSSQDKISATSDADNIPPYLHDPRENHIITSSSTIPIISDTGNDGVNIREKGFALKKVITYEKIPSSGAFATVDAVAYNHLVGEFFWSNVSAKTLGQYHYCLSSHTGSSPNPIKSSNWSREFKFSPSYGSSVDFNCEVNILKMANGYIDIQPQNTNHISAKFNLQFNNRGEREAKSITHFLEDNLGANKFFFTPPRPYNKKIEVVCESFSSNRQFTDSNNINAVFIADNIDSLNWKDAISPYSGDWNSSTNYKTNDFVQHVYSEEFRNHDSYYYARKNSLNSEPDQSPQAWSQDYFFWTPSLQQNISLEPRINKIELENKFAQRSTDGINTNVPALNTSYSNRTDEEAAAMSHFLHHKLGYKPFSTIRAKDFSNKAHLGIYSSLNSDQNIHISGEQTATVNLSGPISIPSQIGGLEIDQEITFPSVSSSHNKVYLTESLNNGATSITVRSIDYADIPSGSSFDIFASTSRVYAPSWTHTWNFKDNNSISTNLIECLFNKPVPNLHSGYYVDPPQIDYSLVGFNSFKDGKITIHNTGGVRLPLSDINVNSDESQFYLTSTDPGLGNKYEPIQMPYSIAGQTTKSFFVRFRPKKLSPNYFSGEAIINIGGSESTVTLTGLTEGNFVVTGHDNIHPSGLTQIILTDGSDAEPIDYLVWKH